MGVDWHEEAAEGKPDFKFWGHRVVPKSSSGHLPNHGTAMSPNILKTFTLEEDGETLRDGTVLKYFLMP